LSLRASKLGYEVTIVDNLSRRRIDTEEGFESLTPTVSLHQRIKTWNDLGVGTPIQFKILDVAKEFERFCELIRTIKPMAIVHYGEQRAAPYSMKNEKTRRYTVDNNLNATHNILNAIVEVDTSIHLVHLGTMGVYGYGAVPNSVIPEGYINIKMQNKDGEFEDKEILHPAYPGSVYHMTKTQDALFFQFYAKNYNIPITDLHQGIVWGLHTPETQLHPHLINRLDYDSDYGTVLNRFIIQSACGVPLTIYGTGQQTRAFIHMKDSVECIVLALANPPKSGDRVKIRNQMTETHRLVDLVALIKRNYPETETQFLDNPRKELIANDLVVENKKFLDLGLEPHYLDSDKLREIYDAVKEFDGRLNRSYVLPRSFW
jgi:UDP-sulfoquinovose synthase